MERCADSWSGLLPLIVAGSGGGGGGEDARVRKIVGGAMQSLRDRAGGRGGRWAGVFSQVAAAAEMALGGCSRGGRGSLRVVLREMPRLEAGWMGVVLLPGAKREAKRSILAQKLELWVRMAAEAGLKGEEGCTPELCEALVEWTCGFPADVEAVCRAGDPKAAGARRGLVKAFATFVLSACSVLAWEGGGKWGAGPRGECFQFLSAESGRYEERVEECLGAMVSLLLPCWRVQEGWERYADWANALCRGDAVVRPIGRRALGNLVKWGDQLVPWSLGICYSPDPMLSRAHFGALVSVLIATKV